MFSTRCASWTVKHHPSDISITREYRIHQEAFNLHDDLVSLFTNTKFVLAKGDDNRKRSCQCARHNVVLSCALAAAWSLLGLASLSDGREWMTVSSPDLKQRLFMSP